MERPTAMVAFFHPPPPGRLRMRRCRSLENDRLQRQPARVEDLRGVRSPRTYMDVPPLPAEHRRTLETAALVRLVHRAGDR